MKRDVLFFFLMIITFLSFGQITQYNTFFDYKNINTQTFIPMVGWNNEQKHLLTILKHSFETQQIINQPKDTSFLWNGLSGKKTIYSKDSLVLFFLRPSDTITRPCILITHGNDAGYRSDWHEQTKFLAIDLAMRGFCIVYYENSSSKEAKQIRNNRSNSFDSLLLNTRNGFYDGFQSAVAANVYVKHHANNFKIDTAKMFAGGYSFGAFCSLTLATADDAVNFTNNIFTTQGNFTAKSIYNDTYSKSIKQAFSIGGALPKDDTLSIYNSKMGNLLDESDAGLSLLFLHGRTDNLISFDLTKLTEVDTSNKSYYFAEGPRAITNTIRAENLAIQTKLVVNCKGGHNFSTSVCGYSNPYCMAQWHWLYLEEPPNAMSLPNTYFSDFSNDTMLRYVSYMLTQVSDVGYVVSDFLQPSVSSVSSSLNNNLYFLQPQDSFKYTNPIGHYITRTTDCEGKPFQVTTTVSEQTIAKDDVKLYPNPAQYYITIASKEIIEKISIYNMLGELVQQVNSNNEEERIDIRSLISGEYIAVVQLKDKLVTIKVSVIH
jgi:hypothetical protein